MMSSQSPATAFPYEGRNEARARSPRTELRLPVAVRTREEVEGLLKQASARLQSDGGLADPQALAKFLGASSAAWTSEHRASLACLLARAGERGLHASLLEVAEHPRAEIADHAAEVVSLGIRERTFVVADLVDAMQSVNAAARAVTLRGLGWSGEPDSVPVLGMYLADPSPEVRDAAAVALGTLGLSEGRRWLVFRRTRETDPDVRASIEESLAELP